MKAIVKADRLPGIQVQEIREPAAGGNPVIRILAAAICGTDLHMFTDMSAFGFVNTPCVMGHEACGVVADPGKSALREGQRVVIDSVYSCGKCRYCRTGRENLCSSRKTVGQNINGVFAKYAALPERVCIPVPDTLQPEVGACIEPFGVALRGVEQANICPGDSVAVIGPGPIGLMAMLLCRLNGAAVVDMIGTQADGKRLALAKELGADHIYDSPEALEGKHAQYTHVLEWSGAGPGLVTACELVAPGGCIVSGAIYRKPVQLDMTSLVRREVTLKTARSRTYQTWRRAIEIIDKGIVHISPLITHRFRIEEAQAAFELAAEKQSVKSVFTFD